MNLILQNLRQIAYMFLSPTHNFRFETSSSSSTQYKQSNLNIKSKFNIFFSSKHYVINTMSSLLSFQKFQYLGLHLASAARWIKIRVSYALNS